MAVTEAQLNNLIYHWTLIVLGSCTFLLNLLVVTIFIRFRRKLLYRRGYVRRRYNYLEVNHNKLLFSMTVGDLLVGFLCLIFGVFLKIDADTDSYKMFAIIPLFGTMFVSIFSLGFMTVDRVIAVIRPLQYDNLMSNSRIKKFIFVSWIVPLLLTTCQEIVYKLTNKTLELKVRACVLTAVFFLGFFILIISNGLLIITIKSQRFSLFKNNAKFESEFSTRNNSTINITDEPKISSDIHSSFSEVTTADALRSKSMSGKEMIEASETLNVEKVKRGELHHNSRLETFTSCISRENNQGNIRKWFPFSFRRGPRNEIYIIETGKGICPDNSVRGISLKLTLPNESVLVNPISSVQDKHEHPSKQSNEKKDIVYVRPEDILEQTNHQHPVQDKASLGVEKAGNDTGNWCRSPITYKSRKREKEVSRILKLKNKKDQGVVGSAKSKTKTKRSSTKDRGKQIIIMCICIVIVFWVCWAPLIGYRFSYVIGRYESIVWFRRLSLTLSLTNSLINPCIYFLIRQDFRILLHNLVCSRK